MERTWTIVGAAFVALAVAVAVIVGTLGVSPTQAAQVSVDTRRSITVVGTGEIKGTPDTATVQVGVQSEGTNAREALTANGTQMQALLAKLREAGIADKDIQTSNFNISPAYNNDGRAVTGYQVNNTVAVTIRDISTASDLLDKVVTAGANNVYGVSFGFATPAALQADARLAAIADARTRADAMAQASGATLGQVLIITETAGASIAPMPLMQRDMAAGNATSIHAGALGVQAQVQVTFELR